MRSITNVLAALTLAVLDAPAIADDAATVPPWNISGDWICIQQCAAGLAGKPTHVIQNGARFVFINESGTRADAEWKGGGQISFIDCDDDALLSPDLDRLEFVFGPVWIR